MPRFLVEYKHVEETTYEEWVEAETKEESIQMVKDNPNFEKETNIQGIEMRDFKVKQSE